MARERRGRSLVEDVYEALRSDILFGRRLPSSRLQLNELAEEHGVSLSVVREAVTRLATEDLVEATPQRGFRVRSPSSTSVTSPGYGRRSRPSPCASPSQRAT